MNSIKTWLDVKLLPEWRIWWKLHSVQLGLVMSAAFAAFIADPSVLIVWLNSLPPEIVKWLPAPFFAVVSVLVFLARFWDQHKALLAKNVIENPTLGAAVAIEAVKGLEAAAKSGPDVQAQITGTDSAATLDKISADASKPLPGQGQ